MLQSQLLWVKLLVTITMKYNHRREALLLLIILAKPDIPIVDYYHCVLISFNIYINLTHVGAVQPN